MIIYKHDLCIGSLDAWPKNGGLTNYMQNVDDFITRNG